MNKIKHYLSEAGALVGLIGLGLAAAGVFLSVVVMYLAIPVAILLCALKFVGWI